MEFLEEKIRLGSERIKELEKKISKDKGNIFAAKGMLIAQPFIFVAMIAIMRLFGGKAIMLYALGTGALIFGGYAVVMGVALSAYKKRRTANTKTKEIEEEIKRNYEKQLEDKKRLERILIKEEKVAIQANNTIQSFAFEEKKSLNSDSKSLTLTLTKKNN